MTTLTIDTAKEQVLNSGNLIIDLVALTTRATILRRRCDKIQYQVLSNYHFEDMEGKKITDPDELWVAFSSGQYDELSTQYYSSLDVAYKKAGHQNLLPGQCPALIAEHEVLKAKKQLVDAIGPVFGINYNGLVCARKLDYFIELVSKMYFSLIHEEREAA